MDNEETDQVIKENLYKIMSGEWDDKFDEIQLEMLKKRTFLLNNLKYELGDFTFEYGGIAIKVHCSDVAELSLYWADSREHIITSIMSDIDFERAYATFKRDWQIDNLLK